MSSDFRSVDRARRRRAREVARASVRDESTPRGHRARA